MKTVPSETDNVLAELRGLGVTPFLVDGALILRGKKDVLTPEVIEKVTHHKPAIIQNLSISALEVIKLLPTGKIDRDQYLKAWESLKNKSPN